jgi:hypothetical protein
MASASPVSWLELPGSTEANLCFNQTFEKFEKHDHKCFSPKSQVQPDG